MTAAFLMRDLGLGFSAGLVCALGGAAKDSPIEGFKPRTFPRSIVVGTLWDLVAAALSTHGLVALAVAGYMERAVVEGWKIARGKIPGKFAARFPAPSISWAESPYQTVKVPESLSHPANPEDPSELTPSEIVVRMKILARVLVGRRLIREYDQIRDWMGQGLSASWKSKLQLEDGRLDRIADELESRRQKAMVLVDQIGELA